MRSEGTAAAAAAAAAADDDDDDDDDDNDDDDELSQFDTNATDITSNTITFDIDAIGKDLERFQSDPIVKKALEQGVDLRQYSRSIDKELQEI